MFEFSVKADTIEELGKKLHQLAGFFATTVTHTAVQEPPLVEVPKEEPVREPVITQAQMAENIANAPVHEEPKQPSIEEVRAALKALRDKKGAEAVRELLKAYNADSLPSLKPEDYLGAMSRAQMEVG